MSTIVFWAQFTANKVGVTLSGADIPTVDVDRVTFADGAHTALVSAGAAINIARRGLWVYLLTNADLATYTYVATFVTANASVDQKELPALGMVIPDALPSTLATATDLATVDGIVDDILLDTGTDGVKLAAGAVTAATIATGAIDADALATDAVAELAAGNWSATTRTLTQSAASVTAAVSGSNISIQRGDVVTINLAALGSIADRTKLWFTVKHSRDDLDSASIIQVEETAGLLYLNGAATTTSNATMTVTDAATGAVTIVLKGAATAALTPGGCVYDVQQLTASGPATLTAGDAEITADVTRAVA
jgi:hypothetical protein